MFTLSLFFFFFTLPWGHKETVLEIEIELVEKWPIVSPFIF